MLGCRAGGDGLMDVCLKDWSGLEVQQRHVED